MKSVSWKETLEQFSWLCIWINLLCKCIKGHMALSAASSAFLQTTLSSPSPPILEVFVVLMLPLSLSPFTYLENAEQKVKCH